MPHEYDIDADILETSQKGFEAVTEANDIVLDIVRKFKKLLELQQEAMNEMNKQSYLLSAKQDELEESN